MRKFSFMIALVAIASCLIVLPHRTSAQNDNPKQESQKWEYKVIYINNLVGENLVGEARNLDAIVAGLETSLNDLGASGWELCLEINGGVILKRLR